jgi:CRP/FNR family transcriptional regulator, cyclic AMP receptor protein
MLDADEIAAVVALGSQRDYAAKASLFHQGEPTHHIVLLLDGWVKVASRARGGEEALLAIRGPGDILGELSAVDGRPRSATVSALVPVRVRVIDGDRFREYLLRAPKLMLALLIHVAASLRQSDLERLKYVSTTSSGRVVRLLLDLAKRHGRKTPDGVLIDLPLTQRELATAAATSREAVARTLRLLRDRHLLRTSRQRIVLVRIEVLHSLIGSVPDDT